MALNLCVFAACNERK